MIKEFHKSNEENNLWILTDLRKKALSKSEQYPNETFVLSGLWQVEQNYRPSYNERLLSLTFVISQCTGHGCCYTDEELIIDKSFIGKDARDVISEYNSINISILDSIYSVFEKKPDKTYLIDGNCQVKSLNRANSIVNEVFTLINGLKLKGDRPKVLNIGCLGILLDLLIKNNISVSATDMNPELIGKNISGTKVESSIKNNELIEESDLVIVTGMTLSTNTLESILQNAQKSNTKIILFAETGANFAPEYCKYGIDVVVSEPFPFYVFTCQSRIDIYRKKCK